MKRNTFVLMLICIPGFIREIFVTMALHDWVYDENWLAEHGNYLQLMGNATIFMFGLFLIITPDFFTEILEKYGTLEDSVQIRIVIALRIIGTVSAIASLVSSRYFINEIFLAR